MRFWSQQELGDSERLWLCTYRPPEVNYSYLCLVPPIWTTQAASPHSSLSLSRLRSSTPGLAPTTQLWVSQPLWSVHNFLQKQPCPFVPHLLVPSAFPLNNLLLSSARSFSIHPKPSSSTHCLKDTVPRHIPILGRKRIWASKSCFYRPVVGNFEQWAIVLHEILVCAWQHDQKWKTTQSQLCESHSHLFNWMVWRNSTTIFANFNKQLYSFGCNIWIHLLASPLKSLSQQLRHWESEKQAKTVITSPDMVSWLWVYKYIHCINERLYV